MADFRERLEKFLTLRGQNRQVVQLTPDASTREYFRVGWDSSTAIACVYPEPFRAAEHNYIDVTRLFHSGGLPVAEIYDYEESLGVIVQEDFGDSILRDVLAGSEPNRKEELLDEAIAMIARIQATTRLAYETGSIASKLKFDTEKLLWELEFFLTHYFETLKGEPLTSSENRSLHAEFVELSEELEQRAVTLCHRDFHAANIMVDGAGALRIIDHQDARIGAAAYDLVSLLLDRITEPPPARWLAEKRSVFLEERQIVGLEPLSEDDFTYEFRLQTIQRCLKANGTFSFQSVHRGKTYFRPFIKPMFQIVLRACENLGRFPVLQEITVREIARPDD